MKQTRSFWLTLGILILSLVTLGFQTHTFAALDIAQTWTAIQTFSNGIIMSGTDATLSSNCPVLLTGVSCVTANPYYASGSSSTTTTVGSTSAGTSVTVSSCSSFSAHQGVYIAGAGVASANYIGTITSCSGAVMVVSPATSTTVSNGTLVQHDDTTAIQSAMQAAATAGGGKVFFPTGFYRVNGPHQDTGHAQANSVLLVPLVGQVFNPPPTPVTITLEGPLSPSGVAMATATNTYGGAVIQTDKSGGNLLGAYDAANTVYGPFTNVKLVLNNLRFVTYDDPNENPLSLYYVNSVSGDNVQIDTGRSQTCSPGCITFPGTHTSNFAIEFPGVNTSPLDGIHNLQISGYYQGTILHEHSHIENVYYAFVAFPISVSTPFAASIVKATVDVCSTAVSGTGPIVIGLITADQCTYLIGDVANALSGTITYKKGSGFTAALNGGANLFTYDISASPTGTFQRLDGTNTATGSYLPTTTGTIDLGSSLLHWRNIFAETILASAGATASLTPTNFIGSSNSSNAVALEIRQQRVDKDVLSVTTNQSLSANLLKLSENGTERFSVTGAGATTITGTASITGAVSFPRANVALANGANNNVSLSGGTFIRVSGPSGVFNVTGFAGGTDGRIIYVFNTTSQAMTITNNSGSSSVGNKILTLTGADVTLRAGTSAATFIYSAADSIWYLAGSN